MHLILISKYFDKHGRPFIFIITGIAHLKVTRANRCHRKSYPPSSHCSFIDFFTFPQSFYAKGPRYSFLWPNPFKEPWLLLFAQNRKEKVHQKGGQTFLYPQARLFAYCVHMKVPDSMKTHLVAKQRSSLWCVFLSAKCRRCAKILPPTAQTQRLLATDWDQSLFSLHC